MKLSIRTKLFGSFLIVVILLIGVSIFALTRMSGLQQTAVNIQSNWIPSIMKIAAMKDSVIDMRLSIYQVLIYPEDAVKISQSEDKFKAVQVQLQKQLKEYEALLNSPEEKAIFASVEKSSVEYTKQGQILIDAIKQKNKEKTSDSMTQLSATAADVMALLQKWTEYNLNGAKTDADRTVTTNQTGQIIVFIVAAIAVIIAIGLAIVISQSLLKSLRAIAAVAAKASQGDLREQAKLYGKDELTELGIAFNQMIENLRKIIGEVAISSHSVAAAAEQISASTQEIASGNALQSQSTQDVHEMFMEFTRATSAIARNAEAAAELSRSASHSAEEGTEAVQESIRNMDHLSRQTSLLEQDSGKIGEIIVVIDEIADQTNLLALNAAIEAARAGEQGRGFAVVADEVRKLAERSGEATKQIASIIRGMQHNMQQSVSAVGEAAAISVKTEQVFKSIVQTISATTEQVSEIAAASEEQSAQAGEVMQSVQSIAAVSEQAAAAAEETASSSQSLAKLADDLNHSVSKFTV
nr:methyl-accepting chemotaxis protein [Paenibacillus thalictri]